MVRNHFFIIWDTEKNKELHSELSKGGEWIGRLLSLCQEIYKLNLQHRLEVIHIGGYDSQTKTFRKEDIEEIGMRTEAGQ